ncbi:ComEC/Rec2 family competence protein [Photobacterium alginatilyticum]|nr:hypothetical protein [Photobacterium alginatilyticum]
MHQINFYPVGNGDTCQIILDSDKRILLDFRHHGNGVKDDSPEIDLKNTLKNELKEAKRNSFDVVAFTHADEDHIQGSTEFFELLHEKQYQGEGRVKINELWVPAAMLLERTDKDKQKEEFVILRQEARHRLKEKKGIKVFSKPDELTKLIESWDMSVDDVAHCIVDAGTLVDTFSLKDDGIEFFVHSPFIAHLDQDGKQIKTVRNKASLIFNIRFQQGQELYDFLAIGDSEWEVLEEIVEITQYHRNDDRLRWDLLNIPHHCSYLALSDTKGDNETAPKPKVEELLLQGQRDAYMICSSNAFGHGKEALDRIQPPHLQSRHCYEKYLKKVGGRRFIVTMEEPNSKAPEPVTIEITHFGLSLKKAASAALAAAVASPARAG